MLLTHLQSKLRDGESLLILDFYNIPEDTKREMISMQNGHDARLHELGEQLKQTYGLNVFEFIRKYGSKEAIQLVETFTMDKGQR